MTATLSQARDEILATFREAWLADELSNELPVQYPDARFDPPESGAWARVVVRHADGGQSTLANHEGVRRYESIGTVFVSVFTPSGEGQTLSDYLVGVAMNAYRGKRTSNGVVFHRVRFTEVGPTGSWFQVNVMADFNYDEVR